MYIGRLTLIAALTGMLALSAATGNSRRYGTSICGRAPLRSTFQMSTRTSPSGVDRSAYRTPGEPTPRM